MGRWLSSTVCCFDISWRAETSRGLVQGLNLAYFDELLAEAKAALWALRIQGAAISKGRAIRG